ncbi:hypothetical protein AAGL78_25030, partial [Klebsiella pneumoniae]
LMMSLWDALRMNMMISYQELVRTFPCFIVRSSERTQKLGIFLVLIFIISTQTAPGCATSTR